MDSRVKSDPKFAPSHLVRDTTSLFSLALSRFLASRMRSGAVRAIIGLIGKPPARRLKHRTHYVKPARVLEYIAGCAGFDASQHVVLIARYGNHRDIAFEGDAWCKRE